MDAPPVLIDGSRVVVYLIFSASVEVTGRSTVLIAGAPLDSKAVRGLAVAENLSPDGGVFLFYCNEEWQVLAAGHFEGLGSAQAAGGRAFTGSANLWRQFRPLLADEVLEVEATRRFLTRAAEESED